MSNLAFPARSDSLENAIYRRKRELIMSDSVSVSGEQNENGNDLTTEVSQAAQGEGSAVEMNAQAPTGGKEDYGASDIVILRGLDAVRKRPGMYIGDTDDGSGLHHMVFEIVDNSVDEAQAGFAKSVAVTLNADGSVSVRDDGRGIPTDTHPEEGVSAAEVVLTKLHAGGKFNQNSYKVSGGLHGVGAAVVNALSDWMKATIWRGGKVYEIEFTDGGEVSKSLHVVGKCPATEHGTLVTFKPSPSIFKTVEFEVDRLVERLRELACLNSGVCISILDDRTEGNTRAEFCYEGGVESLLRMVEKNRQPIIPSPIRAIGSSKQSGKDIHVDIAIEWTQGFLPANYCAYTNNIVQKEDGAHVTGFKTALNTAIKPFVEENMPARMKVSIIGDDILTGIGAVISVKVPDPKFSSQTKSKLVSSEAQSAVHAVLTEALRTWLLEHPREAKLIAENVILAARGREAGRRAREVQQKRETNDIANLPGKLADCQDKTPENCELFLVEGDSAGGTAKQARDRKYQAILPLRGKILNVIRADMLKAMQDGSIGTLITALGVKGIGPRFDITRLRYHKIVIMTDADVDGSHIRVLLLTFFYHYMPELIRRGHIYVAQPPLHSVQRGSNQKKLDYLLDENALDRYLLQIAVEGGVTLTAADGTTYEGDALNRLVYEMRDIGQKIAQIDVSVGHIELSTLLGVSGAWFPNVFDEEEQREGAAEFICASMPDRVPGTRWSATTSPEAMNFKMRRRGVDRVFTVERNIINNRIGEDLLSFMDRLPTLFEGKGCTLTRPGAEPLAITGPYQLYQSVRAMGEKKVRDIKRFKGLGEMNQDQLRETTMDRGTRNLLQVTMNDFENLEQQQETEDYKIIQIVMGHEPEPRYDFIMNNSDKMGQLAEF